MNVRKLMLLFLIAVAFLLLVIVTFLLLLVTIALFLALSFVTAAFRKGMLHQNLQMSQSTAVNPAG
jgi:type III secretory pathway component EscU